MGQGRGREDATEDSFLDAKGPDCVDMQRRRKSNERCKARWEGGNETDRKAPGEFECNY